MGQGKVKRPIDRCHDPSTSRHCRRHFHSCFPKNHLETMPPFGIGCSFKSRHFGFDFTFVWWLLGLSGQVGSTQRDKGGTAGKVGNLRPADFLRGAGYACFCFPLWVILSLFWKLLRKFGRKFKMTQIQHVIFSGTEHEANHQSS